MIDGSGATQFRAPSFTEGQFTVTLEWDAQRVSVPTQSLDVIPDNTAAVYQALVVGMRDYVIKNRFRGVMPCLLFMSNCIYN